MGRVFIPARFGGATVPDTQSMAYTAVGPQTYKKGAVIIYEAGATGLIQEGGADPTGIVGVASEDVDSKPGFGVGHSAKVVATTGRVSETSVHKANRNTIFSGRMVNGGTDPVTPVQTDVGKAYGLLKTGAGEWVVDQAETVNTRLRITDIDADMKVVFFKFLEANLANP